MAKVLISMPATFLAKVDALAENLNESRSLLIRQALREYIKDKHKDNSKVNPEVN